MQPLLGEESSLLLGDASSLLLGEASSLLLAVGPIFSPAQFRSSAVSVVRCFGRPADEFQILSHYFRIFTNYNEAHYDTCANYKPSHL